MAGEGLRQLNVDGFRFLAAPAHTNGVVTKGATRPSGDPYRFASFVDFRTDHARGARRVSSKCEDGGIQANHSTFSLATYGQIPFFDLLPQL